MIDIFYFANGLKRGKLEQLAKIKNKKLWIDTTNITKQELDIIKSMFDLHPLTAEDIFTDKIRIKVEEFSHYLFCVFYGIQKLKSVEMFEIDFILGKNFLITSHKAEIPSFTKLKNNKERLESLLKKGTDFLFHKLLDYEVDNYFSVLEIINDDIEKIEDEITKMPKSELLSKILRTKRMIVLVKKHMFVQREKISFLAKNEYKFISKKSLPYFRDVYDHSIRVSDTIDGCREAISNTFDAYMSAVSNSTNEVMKFLSVIATIALPLTVISSIYGTNFDVLPGQHFEYSFLLMLLLMILVGGIMVAIFRRKHWF